MYLPAEPEVLVGASLNIDVIQWTPKNTGEAVNDIRTFKAVKTESAKPTKEQVQELIEGLADDLSLGF
jgi:hypothetical protein